eukprot:gene6784-10948_t
MKKDNKTQQQKSNSTDNLDSPTKEKVRIVILGSGYCGKSALTHQYMYSKFEEKLDPTIEDCFMKNTIIDNDPIILDILDTGGREEYGSIRDEYMRTAQCFILFFSITDPSSFQDAYSYFEQLLRSTDSNAVPLVLIGNKSDLTEERGVSFDEGKEMALRMGCPYIETSAKENINVIEAFEILIREYKSSEGINDENEQFRDENKKNVNSIHYPKKEKTKKSICHLM